MINEDAGDNKQERMEYNMNLMRAWDAKGPAPALVCVECGEEDCQEDEVYGDVLCQGCYDDNHRGRPYPQEYYIED